MAQGGPMIVPKAKETAMSSVPAHVLEEWKTKDEAVNPPPGALWKVHMLYLHNGKDHPPCYLSPHRVNDVLSIVAETRELWRLVEDWLLHNRPRSMLFIEATREWHGLNIRVDVVGWVGDVRCVESGSLFIYCPHALCDYVDDYALETKQRARAAWEEWQYLQEKADEG